MVFINSYHLYKLYLIRNYVVYLNIHVPVYLQKSLLFLDKIWNIFLGWLGHKKEVVLDWREVGGGGGVVDNISHFICLCCVLCYFLIFENLSY